MVDLNLLCLKQHFVPLNKVFPRCRRLTALVRESWRSSWLAWWFLGSLVHWWLWEPVKHGARLLQFCRFLERAFVLGDGARVPTPCQIVRNFIFLWRRKINHCRMLVCHKNGILNLNRSNSRIIHEGREPGRRSTIRLLEPSFGWILR